MNEGYDPMTAAYGPFKPDTAARALRTENAKRGYRTCWNPDCLTAYRPHEVIGADGQRHQLGRGRWYCSPACARADRGMLGPIAEFIGDDTLVLDLTRCRECAA
jgi:hypothetical protein